MQHLQKITLKDEGLDATHRNLTKVIAIYKDPF